MGERVDRRGVGPPPLQLVQNREPQDAAKGRRAGNTSQMR